MTPKPAIYANAVGVRLTDHELVFEFGAHFPDKPGDPRPPGYAPDLTVVLPAAALSGVLGVLNNLQGQQRQKKQTTDASKGEGKPS